MRKILIALLASILLPFPALALTAGPTICGTGTDQGSGSIGGLVAWVNPGNITASDLTYAVCALTAVNNTSNILRASNFGFSIPGGSTINGIQIDLFGHQTSGNAEDILAVLVKAGTEAGSNLSTGIKTFGTSNTTVTYGGPTNLWGTTWTPAQINSSTFGFDYAQDLFNVAPSTISIDYVQATITYTAGGVKQDAIWFGMPF